MKYADLSAEAKARALDWIREGQTDTGWYEYVYNDAKTCMSYLGFVVDDIGFCGFWSQGDHAWFSGSWKAQDVNMADLKMNATDETLTDLGARLSVLALRNHAAQYDVTAVGRGPWVALTRKDDPEEDDALSLDDEDDLEKVVESLADWIYCRLEDEYDYLTNDKACEEVAREYEFDEDGGYQRGI